MKKILLFIIVLTMMVGIEDLKAQIDVHGGYGWQFGGKMKFYEGEIDIVSDWQWHVGIDSKIAPDMAVRFEYSQVAGADGEWLPFGGYNNAFPAQKFTVDMHYFQLGALRTLPMEKIEPYGLFTLGAAWFQATELTGDDIGDVTRFAIALGGGIKIFPTEKVGFKLQGRLLLPIYFQGVGIWAGTGGTGLSVGGGIPIVQGDLTASLVVRLRD